MATDALRSLWVEPRPPQPPPGGRARDWALVGLLACWSLADAAFRHDMAPLPLLIVAVLATLGPVTWRREHPLAATAVAFGTLTVVDLVRLSGSHGALPAGVAATLLLTFSLFRWGSGREAAGGLGMILLWLTLTLAADATTPAETVAGYAFFLLSATLGAAVRFRARVRIRDIDRIKAREREQLARELHDTVAHHVSGIAIQAQAGRAVAATHPERAVEALATIEDAATRTLTELRAIVGVLRASERSDLAPQPGVAEIARLADAGPEPPCVVVRFAGELDDLSPAVAAAIYRLAQESVTNARRHARHATQVTVAVTSDSARVRLTVEDDGSPGPAGRFGAGYGLVGMRERVTLLGGTFTAGPIAGKGWRVEAQVPLVGAQA